MMQVSNKIKYIYVFFWETHVDDYFILSKEKETINALLKNLSKTFKLTDEGGFKYYIGMNVSKDPNGTITTIQPTTFDKILNSLGICDE